MVIMNVEDIWDRKSIRSINWLVDRQNVPIIKVPINMASENNADYQ